MAGLKPVADPVVLWFVEFPDPILATCVPAKAKKKNMKVPTNSPMKATKSVESLESICQCLTDVRTILRLAVHPLRPRVLNATNSLRLVMQFLPDLPPLMMMAQISFSLGIHILIFAAVALQATADLSSPPGG